MHLMGCPRNSNHYASCTCDAIRMYDHTEALNRMADATPQIEARLDAIEQQIAEIKQLLEAKR